MAIALLGPGAALAQPAAVVAPQLVPQQQQRPNILVWMMDDVGFAQVSCFGGLVQTPNIDRVARMGLRYDNYHTAPICSAARASFLTGRMPHSVNIGGHATAAMSFPGYHAQIPAGAGTVAANLRQAGYATFAVGKWDHLPSEEASPAGPFRYWPSGQGFEKFYGFLAADTDNWSPVLVRDHRPVAKPAGRDYHLSADLADQAIDMIRARDVRDPARPFFLYWATGAAHAPHHAPEEWLARYRGKFDMGWDKARETVLARQKAQGLMPKSATLAPLPEGMPRWDSLSPEHKRLYARQMEAFAAALSHADAQFGRLLDALEQKGELANTLILITSDNGASAEGGPNGLYNEAAVTAHVAPGVAENAAFLEDWGGPRTYPHYAYGWAVAGNTPFRYFKQTTHEGGTRVPLVVAWPKGIRASGERRHQFVHVADIAPTILEAAKVPLAATINDVPQSPMEGRSAAASFASPRAGDPDRAQYVELYGNKGLWWRNWAIVTTHRYRTWDFNVAKTFDEPWELYDLERDPGQTRDLAARHPERVREMARMFEEQARADNVFPQHNLYDSAQESAAEAQADFAARGGKWRYAGPVGAIPSSLAPPVGARSFRMTADLDLPRAGVTGPLFAFGGQLGGIGFYLDEGRPTLVLTTLKGETRAVRASDVLGSGMGVIDLEVVKAADAAPGAPADYRVRIRSKGRLLADERLRFAIPTFFGIGETFGVGTDEGSPVLAGYSAGTPLPAGLSNVLFDFNTRE